MNKSSQWKISKNEISKKKKNIKKISKNKKFFTMRISTNHLNKNIHEQTSPWTKLHKHIKKNLQNQSLKPQRWANHLSIKMNPWPWVINQGLNLDLKLYKKNKRWNSWPRVIHWKPNVNEFWPWVIIQIQKSTPS